MQKLNDQFEENFNILVDSYITKIAIAVSGGADSVALLYLLYNWVKVQAKKIKVVILTVDHNLRPESKSECDYVMKIGRDLGYKCIKLDWNPQGNFSNLQSRARNARYGLMTTICKNYDIPVLLTAHHQDDYIENFIIRQQRKSGIFGLSSSSFHYINDIKVVRPLYNVPKKLLTDYLVKNSIKWFEDASNLSDKYQRGRIRKNLLHATDDFKNSVISSQEVINRKLKDLQFILQNSLSESCKIYACGFAVIQLDILGIYPKVIQLQLLGYILTIIGGNEIMPRARLLYPLLDLFKLPENFILTLHGCSAKKFGQELLIYRLFGKKIPEDVVLSKANAVIAGDSEKCSDKAVSLNSYELTRKPNDLLAMTINLSAYWDNRFILRSDTEIPGDYYVSYLTDAEYRIIKDKLDLKLLASLSFKNHLKILFSLPVVKNLEKIIAIPHISFYNGTNLAGRIKFSYSPKFNSRFINFSSKSVKEI